MQVEVPLEVVDYGANPEEVERGTGEQAEELGQLHEVPSEEPRTGPLVLERRGLSEPHHRLHEPAAVVEAGEEVDEPVPVEEVVVDPPADEPEHVREGRPALLDDLLRDPHHVGEAVVDDLIRVPYDTEGQGRGDARVALDDVRVVPDEPVARGRSVFLESRHGSGLEDKKLVLSVERELDVLRTPEVALEPEARLSDQLDLPVGETACASERLGQRLAPESPPGRIVQDKPFLLRGEFRTDREVALGHRVGVRIQSRADQSLAGAVKSADDNLVHVPGDGIRREHHAACAGVDHLLDDHGDRYVRERQSLLQPVGEGSFVVGRGPDLSDDVKELVPALHEQEAVVEPREGLPGGVLADGG